MSCRTGSVQWKKTTHSGGRQRRHNLGDDTQPAGFIREYSLKTSNPLYADLAEHEIRVLILTPAAHGQPLQAKLCPLRLPLDKRRSSWDACDYEAISYCWGGVEKTHMIRIMGHRPVPITTSLHSALQYLRYTDRPRRLWADALCINQENIAERNAQVAIMAEIYELYSTVQVWLGSGDMSDGLAFAAVKGCMRLIALRKSRKVSDVHLDLDTVSKSLEHTELWDIYCGRYGRPDSPIHAACLALYRLTQRPYFTRLWTVQETWLGTRLTFRSGFFTCAELDIIGTLNVLGRLQLSSSHPAIGDIERSPAFVALKDSWTHWSPADVNADVIKGWMNYSLRHCMDPKDRVFALRNVLNLRHVRDLLPDYSLSTPEIYRRFVKSLLQLDPGELIHPALVLALVGTESRPSPSNGHPTWVADIHCLTASSREKQFLYTPDILLTPESVRDPSHTDAAGSWMARWKPRFSDRLLIRGHCFAQVVERLTLPGLPSGDGGRVTLDPGVLPDIKVFFEWYICARKLFVHHAHTQTDMLDTELMAFLKYPHRWSSAPRKDLSSHRRMISSAHTRVLRALYPDIVLTDKQRSWIYWSMLYAGDSVLSRDRQLWRVESEGHSNIAWLPRQTHPEDQVCIFAGAPWPFVVRAVDRGMFYLIGDGHVHGMAIMEAINGRYRLCEDEFDRASVEAVKDFDEAESLIDLGRSVQRQRYDEMAEQSEFIILS